MRKHNWVDANIVPSGLGGQTLTLSGLRQLLDAVHRDHPELSDRPVYFKGEGEESVLAVALAVDESFVVLMSDKHAVVRAKEANERDRLAQEQKS
jgi:hypothetical protein